MVTNSTTFGIIKTYKCPSLKEADAYFLPLFGCKVSNDWCKESTAIVMIAIDGDGYEFYGRCVNSMATHVTTG
jgi:hypothetical protein